ncbi:MAG: hypothetical protein IJ770_04515 [Alphaproteobacteria bacterium]|nr:hypothetical protein [Alphaproteobacteria bacterium]
MDTQLIALGIGGFFVALILFKFIIKIPFLLIKYGILALIIYVIYMVISGQI